MNLCFNCTSEASKNISVEGLEIPVCGSKNCEEKAEWVLLRMEEDMVSVDDFVKVKHAADHLFF